MPLSGFQRRRARNSPWPEGLGGVRLRGPAFRPCAEGSGRTPEAGHWEASVATGSPFLERVPWELAQAPSACGPPRGLGKGPSPRGRLRGTASRAEGLSV